MGASRPTMVDIARAAGVSTALVSIVMRGVPGASDTTRARVLAVADELGYVPDQRARKLRQRRSRVLGVCFGLRHAFHGDLVEQLYVAAADRGLDLALSATAPGRHETAAAQALLRERPEALILLGPTLSDEALDDLAARVPVVALARSTAANVSAVISDERAGIDAAIAHLVGLGHSDIAHVDGAHAPGSDERRTAFRDAARRANLTGSRVLTGGLTEVDGIRAARELLDGPLLPTAVVAFNDVCAVGVLEELRRSGVAVPGDVSVVGFDDSSIARLAHIDLTTVAQDVPGLASGGVAAAAALASGEPSRRVVLDPHLVVRSTTGPASGHQPGDAT
ncbi:LacI family DNA-binding transcriptional regulator [Actinomycetospora sp. NBRC 106378]|uniref:LacI family DNA-binding transcriptional regulator n=1 Tax=Actinomycetospora sp. NBRC 106378 TaxID=3032208 RepID=UPI0024A3C370|nr:LacI family DNA-binding transcriptional regulator [Actinomycetospora sp. NBRC 106378]GLZ53483.1 LacI family transcriptional regulator [Actinomycetospora sp. NBRC 106378]